jgi:hypothetical protein
VTFEIALKSIFEQGTQDFNDGAFAAFEDVLHISLQYYCPEIRTESFYTPETNLIGRNEVLAYWDDLYKKFDNQITSFRYLFVGKTSLIRCFYDKAEFILDVEMYFDEYAKVYKIVNTLKKSPPQTAQLA